MLTWWRWLPCVLALVAAGCANAGPPTAYPWGTPMTPGVRTAYAVFEQCRTAGGPPTPEFYAEEEPDGRVTGTIYGPITQRNAIAACMRNHGFLSDTR